MWGGVWAHPSTGCMCAGCPIRAELRAPAWAGPGARVSPETEGDAGSWLAPAGPGAALRAGGPCSGRMFRGLMPLLGRPPPGRPLPRWCCGGLTYLPRHRHLSRHSIWDIFPIYFYFRLFIGRLAPASLEAEGGSGSPEGEMIIPAACGPHCSSPSCVLPQGPSRSCWCCGDGWGLLLGLSGRGAARTLPSARSTAWCPARPPLSPELVSWWSRPAWTQQTLPRPLLQSSCLSPHFRVRGRTT